MGAALLKLAGLTFILAALLTQGGEHAIAVWALLFVGSIIAAVVFAKLRQERDDTNRERDDTNQPAYRELLEISIDAHIERARFHQWDEAQRMLRDYYTSEHAAEKSEFCAKRIEYLKVPEPLPAIEDFFPPTASRSEEQITARPLLLYSTSSSWAATSSGTGKRYGRRNSRGRRHCMTSWI
ncbi:MAG: hypothetical protein AB7G47_10835 [Mycolicibacterium sp.]|uniref:hypothetical protein n=1 Tax=Mycolicibacterium sp. TaxID=2320850 RepID=UPI003D10BC37